MNPEDTKQEEQLNPDNKLKVLSIQARPENDKIALIDADTLVYATCVGLEYQAEIGIEPDTWAIDFDEAEAEAKHRIETIRILTGCKAVELHFSSGGGFRKDLTETYKANRDTTRYPAGLKFMKERMKDLYPGSQLHTKWEADDYVVWAKRRNPDKYILCAVDKDVLRSVPGEHFNYYQSSKYNISPKWVVTLMDEAEIFPYLQTLEGDPTDNIKGVPGIGPKKAEKLLLGVKPEDAWPKVVGAFKTAGLSEEEALLTMRLVNMNQFNGTEITLWEPVK